MGGGDRGGRGVNSPCRGGMAVVTELRPPEAKVRTKILRADSLKGERAQVSRSSGSTAPHPFNHI